MTKLISLKQNKDFRRMYHRGKTVVFPALVVYYSKNRQSTCRLGITAGKKIGNAVCRNRVKRIIRAAYSAVIDSVDTTACCYDFVIVARNRCAFLKSSDVEAQLCAALKKSGLMKDERIKNDRD